MISLDAMDEKDFNEILMEIFMYMIHKSGGKVAVSRKEVEEFSKHPVDLNMGYFEGDTDTIAITVEQVENPNEEESESL